jgi:hypothetical protein
MYRSKKGQVNNQVCSRLVISMFGFGEGGILKPLLLHYISKLLILVDESETSA